MIPALHHYLQYTHIRFVGDGAHTTHATLDGSYIGAIPNESWAQYARRLLRWRFCLAASFSIHSQSLRLRSAQVRTMQEGERRPGHLYPKLLASCF
jgi:hypothetical protein